MPMLPRPPDPPTDDRERLRLDPLGLLARRVEQSLRGLPRLTLGDRTVILVARPELARTVLVERLDRLRKPELLRDSNRGRGGDGLTTLESHAWRQRRACLRGAFATERLPTHRVAARALARHRVQGWRVGDVIDLRHELRQLTAATAVRFVLGAGVEGTGSSSRPPRATPVPRAEVYGEDYTASASAGVPLALTRPRAPARMPVSVGLIDAALRERDRADETSDDALGWAVSAGLERPALVDELTQMLFAGHHTVPAAVLAVLGVLAGDPALAGRARAEALKLDDDQALPPASLLERVVQETMRLHPPAPILYREVVEPLELAGERLEPGTGVWVCTRVMHRDPRNFPEPRRFDPDRFTPARRARIPAHAYLPFGSGPRICVASRLAMIQMVEICAAVIRSYRLMPRGGDRFAVRSIESK